jgi:hypothetical protein
MDITELLHLITLGKLAGKALESAKKKIKDFLDKKKYGFTPNKEEADSLYRISREDIYKRFVDCVGNHWSKDLIRVGIYISKLNDEGRREVVDKTRREIYKKYGEKGVKIINIATTGYIIEVIQYLSRLKLTENLKEEDLQIEFEKIIEEWKSTTIFVTVNDNEDSMIKEITNLMGSKKERFFVFGYGSAAKIASNSIDKLASDGVVKSNNYSIHIEQSTDLAGGEKYMCIFKL